MPWDADLSNDVEAIRFRTKLGIKEGSISEIVSVDSEKFK